MGSTSNFFFWGEECQQLKKIFFTFERLPLPAQELAVTRISTKHEMMKQAGIAKNTIRSEDPVAALRAMAKEAQEQPLYVAPP